MVYKRNNQNVGIYCDLCNAVHSDKFRYFSGKIDLVEVDSKEKKSNIISVDRRFLDIDICEKCMNELKDKMLVVIKKREDK